MTREKLPEQISDGIQPSVEPIAERTKDGFHGFTFDLSPMGQELFRHGSAVGTIEEHLAFCIPRQVNDGRPRRRISVQYCSHFGIKLFLTPNASEQFRPAILSGLGDHNARDEHYLSLFQVL